MARICVLLPGNIAGGGTKVPIRLASHLAVRHEVTVMYPHVEHVVLQGFTGKTTLRDRGARFIRSVERSRRPFVWQADLDPRVALSTYWMKPPVELLRQFDAVIYMSVWQYHELKKLDLGRVRRIHWSLADYFYCSGTSVLPDVVLEAYLSTDTLVAPSRTTAADLESYGAQVSAVIGGGIDSVFTPAERIECTQPTLLGYYQPAWWVKGGATMLQVARRLRLEFPWLSIELVGHQPAEVAASTHLVCDRFHTGLSSVGMAALFRRHDVFVYPSYSDGFPAPPLEAMASGCAVATTRVGAVPEYATDGETALICDPLDADALFVNARRLVKDASLRRRLVSAAPAAARLWTWEKAAEQFEELLNI